ncbi:polyribonucleotide nucleotidyltransferase [Chitinophaga costaii]|uniref:Polyribonucleotide nucleotidyltransferase n=1 Tax=Chitinophaga costaii TaxID=1335309 RepID=A0A1C4D6D2_9BACT|nr:polyribonucleotide nucleotidyltransferase [Chitinophaga costaii]PUZ24478.1 polyribonucleotide nucleotidyltransferase [Chitinophaga costaii]SCC26949.1 polyribonucleotide nucleotidyltransferase [Chitinophaga costaii]
MNLTPVSVKFDIGDGRIVTIETGKLARQADGAVTVRLGNAILLATVVAAKEPKPGQSFFPLTVDYMEKFASAGRIPGSFFKREGRLSDSEVLISRLIDRALRPLFPDDYLCEVQVLVTLISSDPEVMPDALACLAASAALAVSDVPIQEIISEVRVARVGGSLVVNPNRSQLATADMDFIIAATDKNIMMVEGESKECQEEDLIAAIETGHAAIKIQVKAQQELHALVGSPAKRAIEAPHKNEELKAKITAFAKDKIYKVAKAALGKHERTDAFKAIGEELKVFLGEELPEEDKPLVKEYLHDLEKEVVRNMILDDKVRLDGRALDEVRPLAMEVDYLPSPHGAALFTRGETQSLTTVTLGTGDDELLIESAAVSNYSKFILHYNFPPFSTGEVKMMRGPGRREVGHGNLAMRSLKQMMPGSDYAYTVRVVSDILESNGSSSMATVCAGSLALMDAGVPLPKHVSGVAMGLIARPSDNKWAVLTDILGDEDHLGDMDFKVTGTRDGICGIQMDIKVDGLSMDVMRAALEQAQRGRLHIIDAMYQCIDKARTEPKPHAPRMEKIVIDREFIGAVIGPGGKIIQEIQRTTGTTINIEEVGETGEVSIFSAQAEGLQKALEWVKGIVAIPEVGETYESTVKSIMPYGAFVEFMPGKQGLLHISEVSWKRLDDLEGVLNEGDVIKVKLVGTDPKTGKFKLSRKVLLPKPEGYVEREERDDRGGDRGFRGGDRRDDRGRGGRDDRGGRGGDRRDDRGFRGGDRRDDRAPREDRGPRTNEDRFNNRPSDAPAQQDGPVFDGPSFDE